MVRGFVAVYIGFGNSEKHLRFSVPDSVLTQPRNETGMNHNIASFMANRTYLFANMLFRFGIGETEATQERSNYQ